MSVTCRRSPATTNRRFAFLPRTPQCSLQSYATSIYNSTSCGKRFKRDGLQSTGSRRRKCQPMDSLRPSRVNDTRPSFPSLGSLILGTGWRRCDSGPQGWRGVSDTGSLYCVIKLCFLLQPFAPPYLIGQPNMMARMMSQLVAAEFSLKGVGSLTY